MTKQTRERGKDERDLPAELAAPARRALMAAGYTRLEQLTEVTEAELMQLHGMGPKAMETLRSALRAAGLHLAEGHFTATRAVERNKSGGVREFLEKLEHPRKAEIAALRMLILSADSRVREEVKWNAPSFYITEHFATFKLQPVDSVQLVLHTGAKVRPDATAVEIDDPVGLLKWVTKGRCMVIFADMSDIESKQVAFTSIIHQWIKHVSGNPSEAL